MTTQAIILNWKRPDNLRRIVTELQNQTVKLDKIIVVDNSAGANTLQLKDPSPEVLLWKFPDDGAGPTCRFAPALISCKPLYTWFIDDDCFPSLTAHRQLLDAANQLNNRFATIGQIGRIYKRNAPNEHELVFDYIPANVGLWPDKPRPVDLTCRMHFVQTANVVHAITIREQLRAKGFIDGEWLKHDDIMLCCGIQNATGYKSYLVSRPAFNYQSLPIVKDLDDTGAMSKLPGHINTRKNMVNCFHKNCNWNSLV